MSSAPHRATKPILSAAAAAASLLLLAGCASGAPEAAETPSGGSDLISAERCALNEAAGPITFLTSFGYVASAGLLDVVVAAEKGIFADLCLDVTIEPGSTNTQLVSAGTAQFAGVGSPSDVLVAIDNGAEITGFATYGNTVANTLLTMADGPIDSLDDFAGVIAGYKGAIPPQISAMFLNEGIDPQIAEWVSVGYDPTILPNGQVQALTGYKSNEPLNLAKQGFDVVEWDPADYGVESAFNTQIVNNAFLEEHPTAVEDFLRASLYAFNWINESEANLDEALSYAEARSDAGYDLELSKLRWATELELITESQPEGLPIGGVSVAQWTPEAEMLLDFELVKTAPDVESAITTSVFEAIYDDGELIWPAP